MSGTTFRRLPSLMNFMKAMQECSGLSRLSQLTRRSLLKEILAISKQKIYFEDMARFSRDRTHQERRERLAKLKFRTALQKARPYLEGASRIARRQLLNIERNSLPASQLSGNKLRRVFAERCWKERWSESLKACEGALISLDREVSQAEESDNLHAAAIHPLLRTSKEKRIVREGSAYLAVADSKDYPLIGSKTPAIDHWFIGRANSVFRKFGSQLKPEHKINNEAEIISHMFWVLFREPRSADSIRKELNRQKATGAPEYSWPLWIENSPWS